MAATTMYTIVTGSARYPSSEMPELLEGGSLDDLPEDVVREVCQEVAAAAAAEEEKEPERKQMTVSEHPPCRDNQWERASKKKNSITLRCRVCHVYWKTRLEFFSKCTAFYAGHCSLGRNCPHPHIFSKACEKHHVMQRELQRQQAETARPYLSLLQQAAASHQLPYYYMNQQNQSHQAAQQHQQHQQHPIMALFPQGRGFCPPVAAGGSHGYYQN
eukprot:TRINITY_DN46592_c0_g1_i1.p1 TRINITY_DN46592_c0_g1~~TRINITY_DN46592_c0_g1_i1.p1  ORF type:complete len:233 (+),score=56.15 TRINITY_DN46592_c0_g1_i1:52-699(+)